MFESCEGLVGEAGVCGKTQLIFGVKEYFRSLGPDEMVVSCLGSIQDLQHRQTDHLDCQSSGNLYSQNQELLKTLKAV